MWPALLALPGLVWCMAARYDRGDVVRAPAPPTHPAVYNRMTVREPERVRAWVTSLPSPLGRLAAAQLAAEVEFACPPAAMRTD